MHRASDVTPHASASTNGGASPSPAPSPLDLDTDGHVCPFCGLTREITEDFDASAPCPRCTLADTPTTRNATKARIGPWHVRQMRNPWAPGMRWETLLALIKRGQVTKDSIVRGPTTHQLWKRASEVKGLSREFGLCYSCGGEIDTQANLCQHCNRLQEPPVNPNVLVETREFAQQSGANVAAASAASATATKSATPTNPRSANGQRLPQPAHAEEAAASLEIGATTPPANDANDMLTVDDPEQAAALARSITSRAPTRPPRKHIPPTPPAPAHPPSAPANPAPAPANPSPAPAPSQQAPRPITLRPRQPGVDDALLTPQELAAAFQLNFAPVPAAGGSAAGVRADAPAAPAETVDDFFQSPPRRKRSKLLVAFVLLLLIGAGAAVLLWVRPDLREQVVDWSQKKYSAAQQFIAARTSPAPDKPTLEPLPATRPTAPPFAQSSSPATRPRPQPIVVTPPALPPPPPLKTEVAVTEPSAPVTSPVPRPPTTRETTRELAPIIETPVPASAKTEQPVTPPTPTAPPAPTTMPAPAPPANDSAGVKVALPPPSASAPQAQPPSQQPQPAAKTWTSISEAEEEARRLWRQAIDAEQNQDFVEAVRCYEQIKKLPEEVHQRGLDVRLKLAKKLVK